MWQLIIAFVICTVVVSLVMWLSFKLSPFRPEINHIDESHDQPPNNPESITGFSVNNGVNVLEG